MNSFAWADEFPSDKAKPNSEEVLIDKFFACHKIFIPQDRLSCYDTSFNNSILDTTKQEDQWRDINNKNYYAIAVPTDRFLSATPITGSLIVRCDSSGLNFFVSTDQVLAPPNKKINAEINETPVNLITSDNGKAVGIWYDIKDKHIFEHLRKPKTSVFLPTVKFFFDTNNFDKHFSALNKNCKKI